MNDALPPSNNETADANLLRERYAQETPRWPGNRTIDVLLSHASCRAFTPEPLKPDMLESLVAAGQSASTSSNLQSWSVVAVSDEARRKELAKLGNGQAFIEEAPVTLLFVADLARLARIADGIGHQREGLDFLELYLVAAIDAALAAQNVCVAAESFGLGTCYIGAMRDHPVELARFLNLPPMAMVVFGVSLGWPDAARPSFIKPRLPQSSILHHETYDGDATVAPLADYERALDVFNRRVRNGQPMWGLRSSQRVADRAILNGRDELVAHLRTLGFPLK